ncbi:MAG: nitrate- and nitrite sensing domain-containing protein [Actinoplanes sp.]
MLLGRLRIRGKLTLLVIIPLLAVAGLVLPLVGSLVSSANRATEINAVATTAGRVGSLLQDVQSERLLSVGYLLGVVSEDELVLQTATVTDRIRDIQRDLGGELSPEARAGIDSVTKLNPLRGRVRAKSVPPDRVLDIYAPVLDGMIESLHLVQDADTGTEAGRQLNALDALLRMDESNTESTAVLAMLAGGDVAGQAVRYHEEVATHATYFERFAGFATQRERELYDLVEAAFRDRVGQNFDTDFEADPARTMAALPIARLFPALRSFSVLGGFVEKHLVDEVTSTVGQQRREQLAIAYGVGALMLIVLLAVLVLVTAVARAVAVPLTQLSRAADLVADAGEAELRRIADDESETIEPVRLEVLDVNSRDEIGDLARVFERVQSTASLLVERQVLSRRNVAQMFGHIGRRTQNLVGGQVDLIDELENEETDPGRLAKLYRLDHIANRLRRSADSLVVISGADREVSHSAPVRLVDVTRLALAEIEEYTRVDLDIPLDLVVAPAVVSDLVLLCGELLENATNFSPPHTRVTVSARAVPGGARLVVADHGIGMPDERLAEENARIAHRERLDLVPTQVLGLFVVGRLARRHQLTVDLSHTPGGGVTVGVDIGSALLAGERVVVSSALAVPTAEPEPAPLVGETLSRVKDAMNVERTWNAFEVDRRQPAALLVAPAPVPPEPAAPAPARPDHGADTRSLHRRVPGASLSPLETTRRRVTGSPVIEHDPDQARSLVEEFESGVARALHEGSPGNRQ